MNIKEYIESGILDAYVLGALSEEECAEVQANIAKYPEVAAEVAAIEDSMQLFAEANAEEPPPALKESIWDAIEASGAVAEETPASGLTTEEPIREMPLPVSRKQQVGWQRAAVWIALVGSILTNFVLWNQNNTNNQKVDQLASAVDSMQAKEDNMVALLDAYKKEKDMIMDPAMQTVVMRSMRDDKSMAGTIYWSKDKGDAYLALHNMPMPPKGKQYQLWVIKDGKPVDMGVIDNGMVTEGMMQKVAKSVTGGEAFAISLEDEGGSPVPNMEQIYVLGTVS